MCHWAGVSSVGKVWNCIDLQQLFREDTSKNCVKGKIDSNVSDISVYLFELWSAD